MKIRFELSARESNVLKNFAVKYAPVDTEIDAFKDNVLENKTGRYEVKNNNGAPIAEANFNEDLVIEGMKFFDECMTTVMSAINILKPFLESFADKAKARFKKWAPDANDVYMSVAKHVANSEKYVGKNFILGLIKDEEWVNVDKDHKVRHDIYLHRPINEIGDLGDVINEAGSKNTEYRFMYVVDGKITISSTMLSMQLRLPRSLG